MSKISFKAGNMLYPLPVVMVSVADKEGKSNILTVAWAGTVCTNPPMVSISVRPERYSYHMLKETGEFVINLTTRVKLLYSRAQSVNPIPALRGYANRTLKARSGRHDT